MSVVLVEPARGRTPPPTKPHAAPNEAPPAGRTVTRFGHIRRVDRRVPCMMS
jgi:hypothetical protein